MSSINPAPPSPVLADMTEAPSGPEAQEAPEASEPAWIRLSLGEQRILAASDGALAWLRRDATTLLGAPASLLWMPAEGAAVAERLADSVLYGQDRFGLVAFRCGDRALRYAGVSSRYDYQEGERLELLLEPADLPAVPLERGAPADPGAPPGSPGGPPSGPLPSGAPEPELGGDAPVARAESVTSGSSAWEAEAEAEGEGAIAEGEVPPGHADAQSAPALAPEASAMLAILETAALPALILDDETRVLAATSEGARILGLARAALRGRRLDEVVIIGGEARPAFDRARREGRPQSMRAGARGGQAHVKLDWVPAGQGAGGYLVLGEIAPEDGITERLRHAALLVELTAHDARRSLSRIRVGLRDLGAELGAGHPLQPKIRALLASCEESRDIIEDVYESSRDAELSKECLSLASVVREVASRHLAEARRAGVDIQVELHPDARLSSRRGRLERIVDNLLTNALHAMDEGGTLWIRTTLEDRERPGVHLVVADEGCGIPEDMMGRIFEPRVSTREGSKGLGLFIVKRFVLDADGQIHCQSELGRGTEFHIWLPRETGAASPEARRPKEDEG